MARLGPSKIPFIKLLRDAGARMTSQTARKNRFKEFFSQPQLKVGLYFSSVPVVNNSQKNGHFLNVLKRFTS